MVSGFLPLSLFSFPHFPFPHSSLLLSSLSPAFFFFYPFPFSSFLLFILPPFPCFLPFFLLSPFPFPLFLLHSTLLNISLSFFFSSFFPLLHLYCLFLCLLSLLSFSVLGMNYKALCLLSKKVLCH